MTEQPTTVANYRMINVTKALRLVVLTRSVREYENRNEEDFPVDLVLPNGATDDFSSNRQFRPRNRSVERSKSRASEFGIVGMPPTPNSKKPTRLLA